MCLLVGNLVGSKFVFLILFTNIIIVVMIHFLIPGVLAHQCSFHSVLLPSSIFPFVGEKKGFYYNYNFSVDGVYFVSPFTINIFLSLQCMWYVNGLRGYYQILYIICLFLWLDIEIVSKLTYLMLQPATSCLGFFSIFCNQIIKSDHYDLQIYL